MYSSTCISIFITEKTDGQVVREYSLISWKGSNGKEPSAEIVGNLMVPANLPCGEFSVGDINPLDVEPLIPEGIRVCHHRVSHINSLKQRGRPRE